MKLFNKIAGIFHKQSEKSTFSSDSSYIDEKWKFTDYDSLSHEYNEINEKNEKEQREERTLSLPGLTRSQILETNHSVEINSLGGIDELLDSSNQERGNGPTTSSKDTILKTLYKVFKTDGKLHTSSPNLNKYVANQTEEQIEDVDVQPIEIVKKPERLSSSTDDSNPFDECFQIVESNTSLGSHEVFSFISEENLETLRLETAEKFRTLCTDGSIRTWEKTGVFPIVNSDLK